MDRQPIEKHILSKSTFLRGCQCPKSLYLYKHEPGLKSKTTDAQQAIFDRGKEVGQLARNLFPGGIDASPRDSFHYHESVKLTQELIQKNTPVIYEAAFQYEQVLAATDILINDKGKFRAYEVKSSTEVKEIYIYDIALQYYVLSKAGINLEDFYIVFVNNQYVRQGEIELMKLFTIQSVINEVLVLQEFIAEKIKELKSVVILDKVPDVEIGTRCNDPYECDFLLHCWKHIPAVSIFDLVRLNSNKKFEMYTAGIVEFSQIPPGQKLTEGQKMQVESYLQKKEFIDNAAVKEYLTSINYPIYYMDFETFQSAIPLFDKSKPYQQIPFQFSVHFKQNKEDRPTHVDFLAEADGDPRESFIIALLIATEKPGTILTYNQSFEISRLKELSIDFPMYKEALEERIARICDLMIPFSKRMYYSPAMNGRYSIKAVLPALIPEMSYEKLEIAEGGAASAAFLNLYNMNDQNGISKVRKNLLEYCQLDTYAMVCLLEKLEEVI